VYSTALYTVIHPSLLPLSLLASADTHTKTDIDNLGSASSGSVSISCMGEHFRVQISHQRVSKRSIGYIVSYTSHFRGWQVYVETLLDCAVYRVQHPPLSHINKFTVSPNTHSYFPTSSADYSQPHSDNLATCCICIGLQPLTWGGGGGLHGLFTQHGAKSFVDLTSYILYVDRRLNMEVK
jgi:hypothetical protein